MTGIAAVSRNQISRRRRQLRRQRRLRLARALWRTIAVSGLAGGLLWTIAQPVWVIRQNDGVVVAGNQFLSDEAIASLLSLSYPQSLLHLDPGAIATRLETQAPIAEAAVRRQLFPPSLSVRVSERLPVAIAYPPPGNTEATVGLLDTQGTWMPLESYTSLEQTPPLPELKTVGRVAQYQQYWGQVYRAIRRSPVKVFEIDWQNPANLIAKTELGTVHFGAYHSDRFVAQLEQLDRLRRLSERVNPEQIAYIDLKTPQSPSLQLKSGARSSGTSEGQSR
jgi:cell division protein FtsQ